MFVDLTEHFIVGWSNHLLKHYTLDYYPNVYILLVHSTYTNNKLVKHFNLTFYRTVIALLYHQVNQ